MSTADDIEQRLVARWAWLRRRRLYRLLGDLLERRAYSAPDPDPILWPEGKRLSEVLTDHDARLADLERRLWP